MSAEVWIEGVVKWYNVVKGFGFVSATGYSGDVLIHKTACYASDLRPSELQSGFKVLVTIVSNNKRGFKVGKVKMVETEC